MNTEKLIATIRKVGAKIEAEKDFLTELDNVIADGDHGINLARGFGEVTKSWTLWRTKSLGTFSKPWA